MANIPGKKEKTTNGQTQEFPHNRGEGGGEVNALTLEIIGRCSKGDKTSTENAKAREKGRTRLSPLLVLKLPLCDWSN